MPGRFMMVNEERLDVVVIGGCGHVGLPLAIALASHDLRVGIYDSDDLAVKRVRAGEMPFREIGAEEALVRVLESGLLTASRTLRPSLAPTQSLW
jgi:UDP-N-acetyl-D-mannosaminuronic acid dehydrogenase